ncbi:hypothetical protein [Pleionea litopenaei]|uniref:Uncharacterized protein n=1 Tax=Pleionea litopenaei TaxID=3070815 RepID=A0AA51RSW0_9GAMM|nr:hypothetical protein [Pleionea sp. HL-JVS1]WMS87027.1 hypothetical protein Q9312_17575 [Pleionea sp. HL-JVS1]
MDTKSRRYTGLIILLISITVIGGVAGLYYYFQIKTNEEYQNRLHFRELRDTSVALDNALEQIEQAGVFQISGLGRELEEDLLEIDIVADSLIAKEQEKETLPEQAENLELEEKLEAATETYVNLLEDITLAITALEDEAYSEINDLCYDHASFCSWIDSGNTLVDFNEYPKIDISEQSVEIIPIVYQQHYEKYLGIFSDEVNQSSTAIKDRLTWIASQKSSLQKLLYKAEDQLNRRSVAQKSKVRTVSKDARKNTESSEFRWESVTCDALLKQWPEACDAFSELPRFHSNNPITFNDAEKLLEIWMSESRYLNKILSIAPEIAASFSQQRETILKLIYQINYYQKSLSDVALEQGGRYTRLQRQFIEKLTKLLNYSLEDISLVKMTYVKSYFLCVNNSSTSNCQLQRSRLEKYMERWLKRENPYHSPSQRNIFESAKLVRELKKSESKLSSNRNEKLKQRLTWISPSEAHEQFELTLHEWQILYQITSSKSLGDKTLESKKSMLIPLSNLFPAESARFPLLLLVNEHGKVIARKDNATINSSQFGLEFDNVKSWLSGDGFSNNSSASKDAKAKASAEANAGYSYFQDITLGGEQYRVFVSPYKSFLLDENKQHFLVGLRAKENLTSEKLIVSNSAISVFILGFLLLIAFCFMLKIPLVSSRQGFSKTDRVLINLGIFSVMGIVSLSLVVFYIYTTFKSEVRAQHEAMFQQIVEAFNQELKTLDNLSITALNTQEQSTTKKQNNSKKEYCLNGICDLLLTNDVNSSAANSSLMTDSITSGPQTREDFLIENTFKLSAQSGVMDGIALWSARSLFRNGKAIDLSQREYYKRANNGQVWQRDNAQCEGIFLQRVFNKRDSRMTTQIAHPIGKEQLGHCNVRSYGATLKTFFSAVMPRNSGYLVFENATGRVLFHSNDSRSLVENLYVETDNNPKLHALLSSTSVTAGEPVHLSVSYRGKSTEFWVGGLLEGVPWSLVVFHDKQEARQLNLSVTILSLVLFFGALGLFGLIKLTCVAIGRTCAEWRPVKAINAIFSRIASSTIPARFRETKTQQILVKQVYWLAIAILVAWFATIVSHNIHQRIYERLMLNDIEKSFAISSKSVDRYNRSFMPSLSTPRFSCYFGQSIATSCHLTQRDYKVSTDVSEDGALWVFNWDTPLPISDIFWALSQKNQEQDLESHLPYAIKSLYQNSLSFHWSSLTILLILTQLVLAFVMLYFVKSWKLKRMLGVHLEPHFRLTEQDSWKREVERKVEAITYTSRVQVIRPTSELINAVFACEDNHFLLDRVINIHQLFEPSSKDFAMIETELSKPQSEPVTLILDGFESLCSDGERRLLALSFLERLHSNSKLNLILICEVAPLYRLTRQEEYITDFETLQKHISTDESKLIASRNEITRWSQLLQSFCKIYSWTATTKTELDDRFDPTLVLLNEAKGWPELNEVAEQFIHYSCVAKVTSSENFSPEELIRDLHSALRTDEVPDKLAQFIRVGGWTAEQIIEFFSANAGAAYRFRWGLCTRDEKFLLYQLSHDVQPNPLNLEPLEHMQRRGYIYQGAQWFICNQSFTRFVRTAENQATFDEWVANAKEGMWKYVRIPLFALVITLAAALVYTATDAIETAISVMAGLLGLIPLAMKSVNLFRTFERSEG